MPESDYSRVNKAGSNQRDACRPKESHHGFHDFSFLGPVRIPKGDGDQQQYSSDRECIKAKPEENRLEGIHTSRAGPVFSSASTFRTGLYLDS